MKPDRALFLLLLKIISSTNAICITDRALEMRQGQGAKPPWNSNKSPNSLFRLGSYGFHLSQVWKISQELKTNMFLSHSLSVSSPHTHPNT